MKNNLYLLKKAICLLCEAEELALKLWSKFSKNCDFKVIIPYDCCHENNFYKRCKFNNCPFTAYKVREDLKNE